MTEIQRGWKSEPGALGNGVRVTAATIPMRRRPRDSRRCPIGMRCIGRNDIGAQVGGGIVPDHEADGVVDLTRLQFLDADDRAEQRQRRCGSAQFAWEDSITLRDVGDLASPAGVP